MLSQKRGKKPLRLQLFFVRRQWIFLLSKRKWRIKELNWLPLCLLLFKHLFAKATSNELMNQPSCRPFQENLLLWETFLDWRFTNSNEKKFFKARSNKTSLEASYTSKRGLYVASEQLLLPQQDAQKLARKTSKIKPWFWRKSPFWSWSLPKNGCKCSGFWRNDIVDFKLFSRQKRKIHFQTDLDARRRGWRDGFVSSRVLSSLLSSPAWLVFCDIA